MTDAADRRDSDFPMARAAEIAAEVLDLHEKGQTLDGEAWEQNATAYKAKCIGSAAILAVKLQDALAEIARRTDAERDVLAERERQIDHEGNTHAHDDVEHANGELALAAISYAMIWKHDGPPPLWPWGFQWWKPKDRRRDLVRAGALILAEIERLDRAAVRGKT